jgi:hypothetical protein
MRALASAILGIPSVALLFLPYAGDTSPWAAVSGVKELGWDLSLALLGAPFFLSVPILLARAQALVTKSFSRGETIALRLLAWAVLAAEAALLVFLMEDILLGLLWLPLFIAAVWVIVLSGKRLPPDEASTIMLRAAWLGNAIWCAVVFYGEWQIGAYLAAFTIVLYTVEITLAFRTRPHAFETPRAILA